jgi:hypothetical protein
VLCILKILDLDCAFREDKPIAPTNEYEDLAKKIREYVSNLEKWQRSNYFAKMVIKHSIIDVLRGAFPDQGDGFILSAKELLNSIEGRHKDELVAFLMAKLLNSRYNDKGALSVHIKSMYDIATKLKALGKSISDGELVQFIMASLPENYERRALDVNGAQVICNYYESLGHILKLCHVFKSWLQRKGN